LPVANSEIAPLVLVKSCIDGETSPSVVCGVLGSVLGVFCSSGSTEDGIGEAGASAAVAVAVTGTLAKGTDTSAFFTFILQVAPANAKVDMESTIRERMIATMIQVIVEINERVVKID